MHAWRDLDGEPGAEVLVTYGTRRGFAVLAEDGSVRFEQRGEIRLFSPRLVDADADGQDELVWRTLNDGGVHLYDFGDRDVWHQPLGYYGVAPVAGDLDGDGTPELLVPRSGHPAQVFLMQRSGPGFQTLGSVELPRSDVRVMGTWDLDGDGDQEWLVAILPWDNSPVYGEAWSGTTRLWSAEGCSLRDIGDVDGDGTAEALCSGVTTELVRLGVDGTEVLDVVDARCNMMVDLDRDGSDEVLCSYQGTHEIRRWTEAGLRLAGDASALDGWRVVVDADQLLVERDIDGHVQARRVQVRGEPISSP